MYGPNHWLRLMDTDRNGVVSRQEFLNYTERTFKRLDTNRNGVLESNELPSLLGRPRERMHAHVKH
jgi:Ca2+-binding EF-hand superfamily protein